MRGKDELDKARWPLTARVAELSAQPFQDDADFELLSGVNAVLRGMTYLEDSLRRESLSDEDRCDQIEKFLREDATARDLFERTAEDTI